jgi:hypothetical protein
MGILPDDPTGFDIFTAYVQSYKQSGFDGLLDLPLRNSRSIDIDNTSAQYGLRLLYRDNLELTPQYELSSQCRGEHGFQTRLGSVILEDRNSDALQAGFRPGPFTGKMVAAALQKTEEREQKTEDRGQRREEGGRRMERCRYKPGWEQCSIVRFGAAVNRLIGMAPSSPVS